MPDHDEVLLRILTENIRTGYAPTAGEIRDKAEKAEPNMFKSWSPKRVSSHLKRYGLKTNKSAGRKVYGRVTPDDLRKIQTAYAVDLGFAEEQAPT